MRPQEILGMVEEAAGTRMFEERKDKAKKTMGKKEKRVDEITSLLTEEITPKLDTLREEKRSFLQWQKACTELERIGRVLRAWEWTEGKERVEKKQAEIEKKERDVGKVKASREKAVKEGEAAEKDMKEVEAKRDAEMKKGGKFKKREEEVAELEKVLVKIRTQVEIKNGSVVDEERKAKGLETELKEVSCIQPTSYSMLTHPTAARRADAETRPSRTTRRVIHQRQRQTQHHPNGSHQR
jgi:structural maintenance of chromosome 2